MKFRQSLLAVFVLISILALSSLVSIKLSFEVPGAYNIMVFENCGTFSFYKTAMDAAPQSKILTGACHKMITRDHLISYLAKQEKSPPAAAEGVPGIL